LIRIKARPLRLPHHGHMSSFIYRCPTTGAAITAWQAESHTPWTGPQLLYVGDRCQACGGLHIVNPATGRMLSEERSASLTRIKANPQAVSLHS